MTVQNVEIDVRNLEYQFDELENLNLTKEQLHNLKEDYEKYINKEKGWTF